MILKSVALSLALSVVIFFVYASIEDCDKTVWLHRLVIAFTNEINTKLSDPGSIKY